MYPMPAAKDLMPFIGDELGQIWLDPYSIQFKFVSGTGLAVGSWIEHVEPNGTKHTYKCLASDGPPLLLHHLLGQAVVGLERRELSFTLRFTNGAALTIHTKLGLPECGTITGEAFGFTVF